MPPASKRPCKLEKTPELRTGLHLDILESQRSDTSGYLADTSLMCQGGTIKVHAFILQAASPFFRAVFASQGAEYPYVRDVMLPDFSVREMEVMLSLIYKGTVNLHSDDEEIAELKNTLKFFGVTGVDFKSAQKRESTSEIEGSLYINPFSRIPDYVKLELVEESFRGGEIEVNHQEEGGGRRLSNPRTCNVAKSPAASSSRGNPPRTCDVSVSPVASTSNGNPPRTCNVAKSPVASTSAATTNGIKRPKIILPRILPTTTAALKSPVEVAAVIPPQPVQTPLKKKKKVRNPDEPETDEEDKDWTQPNFKDKAWFKKEALKCQACDTKYTLVKDVLDCISKHSKQNVRCCFCLRVYPNTECLYRHYAKRHKSAGRESTIMCHFCDQALSYNAVSSHVISSHFKVVSEDEEAPETVAGSSKPKPKPSPTKSTSSTKSNGHQPRVKKELSPIPRVSGASDQEIEYDSDVLEDYDPAPVPILIPSPPKKTIAAPAAAGARRRRPSDSSEEEWSPRRGGGGGSEASSSSTSKKKSKIESRPGPSSSSSSRRTEAAPTAEPPAKKKDPRLKVPDFDVAIEKVSSSGKIISFRLCKNRGGGRDGRANN